MADMDAAKKGEEHLASAIASLSHTIAYKERAFLSGMLIRDSGRRSDGEYGAEHRTLIIPQYASPLPGGNGKASGVKSPGRAP